MQSIRRLLAKIECLIPYEYYGRTLFALVLVTLLTNVIYFSTYKPWLLFPRTPHSITAPVSVRETPADILVSTDTLEDSSRPPGSLHIDTEPHDLAHPREPEHVVRAFYTALAKRQCTPEHYLPLEDNLATCSTIADVVVRTIALRERDEHRAVVYLDLAYTLDTGHGPEYYHLSGHLLLLRRHDQWYIDHGSYRSIETYNLEAYLHAIIFLSPASVSSTRPGTVSLPFTPHTLLQRLWKLSELQGNPQDRLIVRQPLRAFPPPSENEPSWPISPIPRAPYAIRRVQPAQDRKVVALTFDLCERVDEVAGYDAAIVNYLRQAHIRATFYAGGKWMQSHPEKAMQLMADPLFEIGNHGWAHRNLRVLTGPVLDNEIRWTQMQYAELRDKLIDRARQQGLAPQEVAHIPHYPLTMRFPYGSCSPAALRSVAAQGLQAIQWDVVSGDPARNQTASQIINTVLRHAKPGSIVIFHANGRGYETAEALPRLIPALHERGFTFVTVSELLRQAREVIAPEDCYELRPGDNQRYNTLVREDVDREETSDVRSVSGKKHTLPPDIKKAPPTR